MLIVIMSIGIIRFLFSTHHGIGISPDSTIYLGASSTFRQRLELSDPLTNEPLRHYPPLYPILLSLFPQVQTPASPVSRALNLALYITNIIIVARILFLAGRKSWIVTLLGMSIVISGFPILWTHLWLWSEPFFLSTGFLGLLLLSEFITHDDYIKLIISSMLIGLASLTRYAGVAFVITGMIMLFLRYSPHRKKTFINNFCFFIFGGAPLTLWMLRNWMISAAPATSRKIIYHPITNEQLEVGFETVAKWFFPTSMPEQNLPNSLVIVSLIFIIAVSLISLRTTNIGDKKPDTATWLILRKTLVIFSVVYLTVLFISLIFFDAYIPLNDRILVPIYNSVIILLFSGVSFFLFAIEDFRTVYVFSAAIGIVLVLIFAAKQLQVQQIWIEKVRNNGLGYSGVSWRHSPTMRAVQMLPDSTQIFTNAPDAIYFYTKKQTDWLPRIIDPKARYVNQNADKEISDMFESLNDDSAALVFFRDVYRPYLVDEEILANKITIPVGMKYSDGWIYWSSE